MDAQLLGLTDYHEVIKHPMDLGTVKVSHLFKSIEDKKYCANKTSMLIFNLFSILKKILKSVAMEY